ncbi:hypothetical protein FRB94_009703 [Tulasnella sp. JGI-2019a]|nr:hypothetical protein FRB93_006859 [Tulasnella sp. JGI-2019a]KAG8994667.1 hypothetical protein FRB94_009703 [Tulasnella sp. JGI-2019a]
MAGKSPAIMAIQVDSRAGRSKPPLRSPTSPVNAPPRYWSLAMANERDQDTREYRGRPAERDISLPNPVSLFDYHLKVLDNSYIAFFQERIRIEEQFIASLAQLHQRTRYLDSQVDGGTETNTTLRQAWREARENVEREAEARGALVDALRADVIGPLIHLKESQDRSRKRIKEEIKDSYQAHVDYQDNVLPKLKQKYLRKVQDVEEYRNLPPVQSTGFAPIPQTLSMPSGPPSPTSTTQTVVSESGSPPKQQLIQHTGPPLQNIQGRPAFAQARNRSPSGNSSLSDLAQQGRKALKGLLQDGPNRDGRVLNTMREGDARNQAMKTAKAKREADEADKDYRKGVHWLETLRLRRANTIRSGYTSLEDFIWEEGATVKRILQKYVDCLIGTYSTTTQLATHVLGSIDQMSWETDREINTKAFANVDIAIKRALPQALYYNFLVGDSKDLIFGTGLVDYATERGVAGGPGVTVGLTRSLKTGTKDGKEARADAALGRAEESVPRLVKLCINDIDARGLFTEGIYRVSGRHANVQEMRHLVEKDEMAYEFNPQTDDVFCVSSLLKQYLRELPEPVFRFPLQERIQHTKDREEHIGSNFLLLRGKIRRLPPIHQATLRLVLEHLARVAAHCAQNKMDPKNLSIVFGTLLFGEDDVPIGTDLLSITAQKDTVLEDLISYCPILFEEKPVSPRSVPLPSVPPEEPAVIDHTSSRTKVRMHGSPSKSAAAKAEHDRDFALDLPAHADKSIHPGHRNRMSTLPPLPAEASVIRVQDLGSPREERPPSSTPTSPLSTLRPTSFPSTLRREKRHCKTPSHVSANNSDEPPTPTERSAEREEARQDTWEMVSAQESSESERRNLEKTGPLSIAMPAAVRKSFEEMSPDVFHTPPTA